MATALPAGGPSPPTVEGLPAAQAHATSAASTQAIAPSSAPVQTTRSANATQLPRASATPNPISPTKPGAAVAPAVERERTSIEVPAAAQPAVAQARADLARRLGIDEAKIEVLSVQPRSRPSGASDGVGKPEGWLITLADATTSYRYQVDARGRLQRLP